MADDMSRYEPRRGETAGAFARRVGCSMELAAASVYHRRAGRRGLLVLLALGLLWAASIPVTYYCMVR